MVDKKSWEIICQLYQQNKATIESFDTTEEIKRGIMNAFDEFQKRNT